jgi:hypothetical protein
MHFYWIYTVSSKKIIKISSKFIHIPYKKKHTSKMALKVFFLTLELIHQVDFYLYVNCLSSHQCVDGTDCFSQLDPDNFQQNVHKNSRHEINCFFSSNRCLTIGFIIKILFK